MGIEKAQTSGYHPQANSQAEILMKHIGKYLLAVTTERKEDWEDHISSCQHAYNLSIQNSLKNSPFNCLFRLKDPVNSPN